MASMGVAFGKIKAVFPDNAPIRIDYSQSTRYPIRYAPGSKAIGELSQVMH